MQSQKQLGAKSFETWVWMGGRVSMALSNAVGASPTLKKINLEI